MLAFFDESGNPHPNDSSTRPVCVSICIREEDVRFISGRLHSLKRSLLGTENLEIKANKLLNKHTFRRIPEKREFVEMFFDLVRNLPINIFSIIMERPQTQPLGDTVYLPNQYRYLLQRCDLLAQETKGKVTILFDGECRTFSNLILQFNSFLYRSIEGRLMDSVTDSPYFVDSRVTSGIQIADMAAGTIRLFEENKLYQEVNTADPFLSAIKRYYNVLVEKTKYQETVEGYARPGFYRMPEHDHYAVMPQEEVQPEETGEDEDTKSS